MRCPVCGVSRDVFADEAAWFAHVAIHPREVPDDPWQQARVVPVTSRQGKRLVRERARQQVEWRKARKRIRDREGDRWRRLLHPERRHANDRRFRERHPEAQHLAQRRFRERHREELNLYNAVYRQDNRERELARHIRYNREHRDELRAYRKVYNEANRERNKALDAERYLRKRERLGIRSHSDIVNAGLAREDEAARLKQEGWTWEDISELTGWSVRVVRRLLCRPVHKAHPGLCACERHEEAS